MSYLAGLNEPQRAAVELTEGPLMIIAGAGSGKTRVLTYRIAHLLAHNVDAFSILSLTFTNKAAKEMRNRIDKVVGGSDAKNIWMGTFHSVFARILRSEAEKIGFPSNFTVYDTDDSKSLIKTIVKEMGLDDKLYKANTVLGRISNAKNKLISPGKYLQDPIMMTDDQSANRPKVGEIYKKYADRCFKAGAMDFDDLLYNTNVLFRDCPDILNKYQKRFKYVMVDEYQDTNYSQYLITKKLAAINRNICVVGDDAQSIYAFRGADIQNILNFEKDYPDLRVIKLEQNYRSTQNIVNAANSVISNNKAQLRKDVWTSNAEGGKVELLRAASDSEEGKMVANSIFEDKNQNQLKNSDFAILYRTNSQSRSFEESLRKLNITYRVIGGTSFYQRKEVKDVLSYLRMTLNHNDEEAVKRVINYPKRGIGDTTVSKLMVWAEENTMTLWDVIKNISHFAKDRSANAITEFAFMINTFEMHIRNKDAFEAASIVAKESGILKELFDDKSIEGISRYQNVQELLNGIKEFTEDKDREDHSLGAYLQEISLLTNADEKKNGDDNYVSMMTIHSSKGLEFKNVYIVGLEEDLFPSQMMLSSRSDLEEERRLFYVAVTRAETKLTVSYALTRYKFGKLFNCEPSRFIEEIDKQYINIPSRNVNDMFSDNQFAAMHNLGGPLGKPQNNFVKITPKPQAVPIYKPSANFAPSDTSTLSLGMKVEHPKFGIGIVVSLDFGGADKKATITFDSVGEKTLLLSFAKLMIC